MRYTPNYNMVIGEGTDAVNPLTQIFPNFETIDSAMENNKNAGITTASEVTTGGVHAIVRVNTSAPVFRFTATSAWTTGDTMTLDGSAVNVHLTDGTAPKSGAYVIGAEVVGIVNGSLVTLLAGASFDGVLSFNSRQGVVTPQSGDYTANMIGYNNTNSGLAATNTQDAIDELASSTPSGVRLVYETTQTNVSFGTLLTELKPYFDALTDDEKANSYLVRGNSVYICSSTIGIFVNSSTYTNNISNSSYRLNDQTCFESGINGAGTVTIQNTTNNLTSEHLKLYTRG